MKFVTGGLNAATSAKRHGDKRRDPEALDENDALSHELTPKLHRWLLILFVGRRENTPVTAVQAVDVVANALRPAVQLSSSMSTCEQAICVRKVHLLMKDVALSWCKELKVANGKSSKNVSVELVQKNILSSVPQQSSVCLLCLACVLCTSRVRHALLGRPQRSPSSPTLNCAVSHANGKG